MGFYSLRPYKKQGIFGAWFSNLNTTGILILINVLIFILFFVAQILATAFFKIDLIGYFALQANSLFNQGYVWTLLTSMFLHAGFFHLFVNMLSLFYLGGFLEMIIGRKRFISLYLISGIFAGFFFAVLSYFFGSGIGAKIFTTPETFAVGASGAIFALAGVLAVLTPKNRVYLVVGPLIAIVLQAILSGVIPDLALSNLINGLVTVYIFVAIFSMFSINPKLRRIALPLEMPFWILPIVAIVPLVAIGLFFDLPIGNMAHLGGVLFGMAYGFYLRIKYKKKTRMIAKYFSK
jgi:membrane associated rhomboid family serine protease